MAMKLDSEKIIPIIKGLGFINTSGKMWKKQINEKNYLIDFGKDQICRLEDTERIDIDKEDVDLQYVIGTCLSAMFPGKDTDPTAADVPDAVKEDIVNQPGGDCGSIGENETYEDIHGPIDDTPPVEVPAAVEPPRVPAIKTITGIKGITTQLCECGKVKIGMKGAVTQSRKGNSFRPPKKLDHFLVTTTKKTAEDDFETDTAIMETIGDNCTELPVILLYDTPGLNFLTSYAYYDSAKCQCRGDGERAIKADGSVIECNPETCNFATTGKCKPNGILSVMLQDAPRVGGVWKFRTTGWNSIRNLMSSIEFIHGLTGGRLAGLDLVLVLHEKTTVIPGTKTVTKVQMVNLEYRGNLKQLMAEARDRYTSDEKMAEIEASAAIKLSLPESADECKDVQEEFYPETVVVE